ncbi:hypothetical protein CkaCkLH20_05980 [Colletotrichum karsti]|uniref:Zn(2)-C6 fungal-type domain-containing protein n=1 Tax=Colletotrichum karsti TaxID=1095194 RepID=A0A9P6LLH0_9PEZI|nr:uncharacterized protein CkaCkLH20_05980 [Colletotrichum karsti]KAF9876572.1 hypothetical protein CkaCkLH20_05980 [Colletotrichum karsti]
MFDSASFHFANPLDKSRAHGAGAALTSADVVTTGLGGQPVYSPASPPVNERRGHQITSITPPPSNGTWGASQSLIVPVLPHTPPRTPTISHRVPLELKAPDGGPINKRKRASKPKVRSGCITCKIRRVKCDEAKPTCKRCGKADIKCDGYVKDAAEVKRAAEKREMMKAAQAAKRQILPRPDPASSQTTTQALMRANPTLIQIDSADVSYYDLFRNQLIRDLSGTTHSDFWSRIVLNESSRDPCVKESILAIGAISQTLFFQNSHGNTLGSRPPTLKPWDGGSPSGGYLSHHHRAALQHHIKAVSVYRQRIQKGTAGSSPRSVIIMTLLLIAFEFIQGNMKAVDLLMGTGMRLIESSVTLMQRSTSSREDDAGGQHQALAARFKKVMREDEMDDIEHLLPCLSLMSGFTHFFNSHRDAIPLMNSTPSVQLPQPGVTDVSKLQILWGKFFTRAVVFIMRGMHMLMTHTIPRNPAVKNEKDTFLTYLGMWKSILDVYLLDPNVEKTTRRALEMIKIQRTIVYVLISCSLEQTEMEFDAFEPEFREMMQMTMRFMRDPEPLSKIAFTFAEGLTTPLTTIIAKCRNHDLRMKAANLMKKLSWRDGAWDGKALVVGKLGVVMLEEQRMDAKGRIPPDSRWIWSDAKWDLEKREVVSTYVRLAPDENGRPVRTTLVLDIDNPPDSCSLRGCTGRHDPWEDFIPDRS